ncbi:DsbA family oxidoreductase [Desulfitobacterium sp.]|uniref:DsbA family oxidoreductase n=1 Tax=Desulfitobacterium sp. TaxID=49981 RepID=UPI002B202D5D|nr:DsbA family protein [Desulfitobacterium sp.]MEA4902054.1 DsbA family protein [Desulfitobacterium sp.]
MGNGIVKELKKECDIRDEWISYELHPEIPKPGISRVQLFPGIKEQEMQDKQAQLNRMGAPYGLCFKEMSWIANTNLALQASEYARDYGKFHEYHEQLLYANYTLGKKIGELNVLLDIAQDIGLDSEGLKTALQENRYQVRLIEAGQKAEKDQIMVTPTFIINDRYRIVGAQSLNKFRKTFREISLGHASNPFTLL